ncbi:MAG: uroporphyrinogen-III C-methyltransferase [Chlamydiae bacterium]|nr:uroporphyrinogen-III C-methyltransferase [Chlamydiota bacterium]MBI3277404.1 uroporphyrinogen-III C-methyltransferase [Chlamydiota bacterium]
MTQEKKGKVYLVGAGPGDPGLLTVKALHLIQEADVLVYDALVSENIIRNAPSSVELIFVGKRGGEVSVSQKEIEAILIEKTHQGKTVVRLKGGDPFIFGRGAEEALFLTHQGIDWEVVPGVSSAVAVPAYAGIPLTHRDFTSSVGFLTGHENSREEESQIPWSKISTGLGTLVFLMGVSQLQHIVHELIRNGRPTSTPCAMVMWGTLPRQKTVVGNLSDVVGKVKEAGLEAPSIFIVGEVVRLREKLNWFEKGPLFGKRILVTRSREQASTLVNTLEKLGADPIEFPVLQVVPPENWAPIDQAIFHLAKFNWIVFTSVNAVNIFLERLKLHLKDIRDLKGIKIAAMGDVTREALEKYSISVDLTPREFVSEALLESFKELGNLKSQNFLLPRAEGARILLSEGLKKEGAWVTDIILYKTVYPPIHEGSSFLHEIFNSKMDWVTFTSSSTVKNFVESLGNHFESLKNHFKVASIGPITSATARGLGLKVDIEAKVHTIEGLVEALVEYENPEIKYQKSK